MTFKQWDSNILIINTNFLSVEYGAVVGRFNVFFTKKQIPHSCAF